MIIKTKEFHKILTRCFKFVSHKGPISSGFKCFRFEEGTIRAFSKDKGIAYARPGFVFEKNYFVLADFLVKTTTGVLHRDVIDMEFKESKLCLKSETGEFLGNISVSIPEEDFDFPKLPKNEDIMPLPEQLFWFIDKIFFAAMKEPIAFNKLSGVFVDKNVFYATNNLILAKFTSDAKIAESFIMPDDLAGAIKDDKNPILCGFYVEPVRFWLKFNIKDSEDTFLAFANTIRHPIDMARLRDSFEEFPKDKPICQYMQDDVLKSLKEVKPWAYGTSKRVTFELQKDKMIFTTRNDIGKARSEVRCEYSGEPINYVFGLEYLKTCIEKIKTFSVNIVKGRCRLYFTDGGPLELLLINFKER